VIIAEVEKKRAEYDDLEDGLTDNVAQHNRREDRICAGCGFFIKEAFSGFLSS